MQTQQLIAGGRRAASALAPDARCARSALDGQEDGSSPRSRTALAEAYVYLRRIEHRLQMVADERRTRCPDGSGAAGKFRARCVRLSRLRREVLANALIARLAAVQGLLLAPR